MYLVQEAIVTVRLGTPTSVHNADRLCASRFVRVANAGMSRTMVFIAKRVVRGVVLNVSLQKIACTSTIAKVWSL